MTRALSIVLALALLGCGEKKADTNPTRGGRGINPRAEYTTGVTALQGGDYAKALSAFERAVGEGVAPIVVDQATGATAPPPGIDPDYARAWYNAGYAAAQLGEDAKSVRYYQRALQLQPDLEGLSIHLGGALQAAGKAVEAVDVFRVQVEKRPDDLDTRNSYVDALTKAKRFDDAVKEAQEILARDPKNVGAYRNLSATYFAQGRYEMALLCAEKAKEINDGDAGIYNNIGIIHLAKEDEPSAIAEFKQALALDAKHLQANLNLGTIALKSGDYALALSCFTAAVGVAPQDRVAQLGHAIALRGTKDYAGSEKVYDSLLSKASMDRVVVLNAVTLHEKYTKNFKKAVKILETYQQAAAGKLDRAAAEDLTRRLVSVRASEEAERARLAELERKRKEAEERKARAEKLLVELAQSVAQLEKDLAEPCIAGNAELMEMAGMILDQVRPVVAAKDSQNAEERQSAIDSAPDLKTFVDDLRTQVDAAKSACVGAAPAEGAAPPTAPSPG
jgi:tetratricopeptide (TPR) repeat protein